jgi:hypothetical protein
MQLVETVEIAIPQTVVDQVVEEEEVVEQSSFNLGMLQLLMEILEQLVVMEDREMEETEGL